MKNRLTAADLEHVEEGLGYCCKKTHMRSLSRKNGSGACAESRIQNLLLLKKTNLVDSYSNTPVEYTTVRSLKWIKGRQRMLISWIWLSWPSDIGSAAVAQPHSRIRPPLLPCTKPYLRHFVRCKQLHRYN